MYASQTKRLCVRGAPSDDTRVQHHSSSDESATATAVIQQRQHQRPQQNSPPSPNQHQQATIAGYIMTTSATRIKCDENGTSFISPPSPPQLGQDRSRPLNTSQPFKGSAEYELINKLANETLEETKIELLLSIRNLITACNKKKDSIVSNPNFNKIVNIIDDDQLSSTIKTQLVLLLCSVAKSGEHNVKILNDCLVDGKIFNLILSSKDEVLIEAGLRCMRSIMSWPKVSRTWLLYESQAQPHANSSCPTTSDRDLLPRRSICHNLQKIISYAQKSNSFVVQECVADIFGITCSRSKDQALLYKTSAIPCIAQFLASPSCRVVIAALNWLTHMCLRNEVVSLEITNARCQSGVLILDRLSSLMGKDNCNALQFLSAQCFTYIYRATYVLKDDLRIVNIVLPTLTRMTHRDKTPHLRVQAAECIAYLIQSETRLQNIASVCDNLIDSLADLLDYEGKIPIPDMKDCTPTRFRISRTQQTQVPWFSTQTQSPTSGSKSTLTNGHSEDDSLNYEDEDSELTNEMKRAAFLALASLASNLEPIRKKILLCPTVMPHLIAGLTDTNDPKTLKSILNCLLSLSRSVHQLRTNFAETSIYIALKNLLSTACNDVLILVLAILCNITLDFSPGKQHFLDIKTIDTLCGLTRRSNRVMRLHGMWILMNMAYHLEDQNLKFQILRTLGINHIIELLDIEDDEELVLKTLGLLRNLLSNKMHIDAIMGNHGEQIMQALIQILNRPCSSEIKEQSLCVLTNIADGSESKTYIMGSRAVLEFLARTICDEQTRNLKLAAICCITNLAHKEFEGSYERRDEMKKLGIEERLKYLLNTDDPILSDRVRTAYNQFLISIDDKYVT